MEQNNIKWSGYDLTPLAYESSTSCLLRLAWRNVFDLKIFKRHLSDHKNKFCLNVLTLSEEVGWHLDKTRLQQFASETYRDCSNWLTDQFRYCPLCLECGYHSDLFQCTCFTTCPLHGAQLSTRCHSCGCSTARNEVSQELFQNPYYCHVCREPISGAEPSLDAHLDLRENVHTLEAALAPYDDWWQFMTIQSERIHSLLLDGGPNLQSLWCNSKEFLRGVVLKDISVPDYVRSPMYNESDIVVLTWRFKIQFENCPVFFPRRSTWAQRVKTPTAVYRCILRRLGRWVAQRHAWSESQLTASLRTDCGNQVAAYPIDLLAFMCFRWQLERRFTSFPDFATRAFAKAQLDDEPEIAMAEFRGKTPRLGWRAVFLAMYASWYGRIASGTFQSVADLHAHYYKHDTHIFFRSRVHFRSGERWSDAEVLNPDEAWFEGKVCFLKIDGLPLT